MNTREGPKLKRSGGRWVRAGEPYRDRHRVLRAILHRVWYLLLPVLVILWTNSRYVRPVTEDATSVMNRERGAALDRQDSIRVQVDQIQSLRRAVETELDTLLLPQIELQGALHDSLCQVRLAFGTSLPRMQSRLDSLSAAREQLEAELVQLADTQRARSAMLRELQVWRATLEDSLSGRDSLIALRSDELYRKQHPLEFRRKEALFTGKGSYPLRQEVSPRAAGR